MGWLEMVLLSALGLWLAVAVFLLVSRKKKGCNGCCADCGRACGSR